MASSVRAEDGALIVETIKGKNGLLNLNVCEPAAGGRQANILLVCQDFPGLAQSAAASARACPELGQRLASETGWTVCCLDFRGTGRSEGDFSLLGWIEDVHSAVGYLRERQRGAHVWLAGFGEGGAVALCAASGDDQIRGVVGLAAPADFSHFSSDPESLAAALKARGMFRSAGFPTDPEAWSMEFSAVQPLDLVKRLPPRPVLLIHGSQDEVASPLDARAYVDAVEGHAELRILTGADHNLRHDPRAVALLLGWMERQTV